MRYFVWHDSYGKGRESCQTQVDASYLGHPPGTLWAPAGTPGDDDDQEGDGGEDGGVSEEGEVEETEGTPEVGSKRQIPTTRRSTRKRQKGL